MSDATEHESTERDRTPLPKADRKLLGRLKVWTAIAVFAGAVGTTFGVLGRTYIWPLAGKIVVLSDAYAADKEKDAAHEAAVHARLEDERVDIEKSLAAIMTLMNVQNEGIKDLQESLHKVERKLDRVQDRLDR